MRTHERTRDGANRSLSRPRLTAHSADVVGQCMSRWPTGRTRSLDSQDAAVADGSATEPFYAGVEARRSHSPAAAQRGATRPVASQKPVSVDTGKA